MSAREGEPTPGAGKGRDGADRARQGQKDAGGAKDHDRGRWLAELCTDIFVIGLQVRAGSLELPDCDTFRRRVLLLFDELNDKATRAGMAQGDIDDARYALAAYLDEIIQYANWEGKREWAQNPLQALLFGESQAGTRFFVKLEELRNRRSPALRVYYTCLLLGFLGEYRLREAGEQARLIEGLGREVGGGGGGRLSPRGERSDQGKGVERAVLSLPLALLGLGVVVLTVVVLYALLSWNRVEAVELLDSLVRR